MRRRFPTGVLLWACACVMPHRAYAQEHAPAPLRVGTVNMWGIAYVSTHMDERFAALAARLNASDLDVVGLQEVWAAGPRTALREAVAARFPYQADFQGDRGASGLLILSRFPIVERHYTAFPVNGKPWKPWHGDWYGGKGVGIVRLERAGDSVWFATTHLHARYSTRPPGGDEMDDEYAFDRWHQVHLVRRWVAEYAGDDPAIVVGDFNFTRRSLYYAALRAGVPPGVPGRTPRQPWTDAAAAHSPAGTIDYLWVRPGRAATWAAVESAQPMFTDPVAVAGGPPQPLTDHPALRATFVRRSAPAAPAVDRAWTGSGSAAAFTQFRAMWHSDTYAGRAAEVVGVFVAAAAFLFAGMVCVGPWRRPAGRAGRGLRTGAGIVALILGLALSAAGLDYMRARARAFTFWQATAPADPVALPLGSAVGGSRVE